MVEYVLFDFFPVADFINRMTVLVAVTCWPPGILALGRTEPYTYLVLNKMTLSECVAGCTCADAGYSCTIVPADVRHGGDPCKVLHCICRFELDHLGIIYNPFSLSLPTPVGPAAANSESSRISVSFTVVSTRKTNLGGGRCTRPTIVGLPKGTDRYCESKPCTSASETCGHGLVGDSAKHIFVRPSNRCTVQSMPESQETQKRMCIGTTCGYLPRTEQTTGGGGRNKRPGGGGRTK